MPYELLNSQPKQTKSEASEQNDHVLSANLTYLKAADAALKTLLENHIYDSFNIYEMPSLRRLIRHSVCFRIFMQPHIRNIRRRSAFGS